MTTWEVKIDTQRDGTFAGGSDDVTSRVLAISWSAGMANAYDEVAPPSSATITLRNTDNALSPDYTSGTYYGDLTPGVLVRIRATSGSTYTMWIGKVDSIKQDIGAYSPMTVTITAKDAMLDLLDAEFSPPIQTDVTIAEALEAVFNAGILNYPYMKLVAILGATLLGQESYLAYDTLSNFDVSATRLEFVGDNSGNDSGVSAQGYIRELVAAEVNGRFFWNARTNKFVFHNRHRDITATSVLTLTQSDIDAADVRYGDAFWNDITINYTPREVGGAASTLYESTSLVRLEAGETRRMTLPYKDADTPNARVGGMEIITPVKTVDVYIADTATQVVDLSSYVDYTFTPGGAQSEIVFRNNGSESATIRYLRVRGTPLKTFKRETVHDVNAQSIHDYERRPQVRTLSAVGSNAYVTGAVNYLLDLFANPIVRIASVTFSANRSAALTAAALARTIGDRITITDSSSTHNRDYIIVGEKHTVTPGGDHAHNVTWVLKPHNLTSNYTQFNTTGHNALGTNTYLVF